MADRTLPPAVLTYATPGQLRLLEAAARHPTDREAAAELGVDRTTITHARTRCRRRAAAAGVAPDVGVDHPQPVGQAVGGLSTLYKLDPAETGGAVLRWVKTNAKAETVLDAMRNAAEDIADAIRPVEPLARPEHTAADLLAVYALGDPHFGMYADARETGGADYDTAIASALHRGAIDKLAAKTPRAGEALLVSIGDLLHADGRVWATSRSGHPLDGDTRFGRVYGLTLQALGWMIDRLLQQHDRVGVVLASGNHDDASSYTMALALRERYRNEPRVAIDDVQGGRFHYHEFGRCLLGMTHGDGKKAKINRRDLGEIMAHDQREAWGRVKLCHWLTGHVHHEQKIEGRGWTAESLSTLAPGDAHAVKEGYRSKRSAKALVLNAGGWPESEHYVTAEEIAA